MNFHNIRINRCKMLKSNYFIILLLVALFLFQLVNLDSDPSPLKRIGDLGDEGYWVHNARSKVLFDTFTPDDWKISYFGAPLFNLLTYTSFKLVGVSYFSARLVSMVSLWLIIILIYFMLKPSYGNNMAIITTVLFGVMHELLMYVKWGTPLLLEMFFYTAILFLSSKQNKTNFSFYLIGIAYSFAILSKLTALLFSPVLASYLFLELLRNKISVKDISRVLIGFFVVIVPFLVVFVIPNIHEYKLLLEYTGSANISINNIIKHILYVPFGFTIMQYPSTYFVFIPVLLYFAFGFFKVNNYQRLKYSFNNLTSIELFCICWIVIYSLSLCINGQFGYDRRMIHFYIPLFILASQYLINTELSSVTINNNQKLIVFIITSILSSIYLAGIFTKGLHQWINPNDYFSIFPEIPFKIRGSKEQLYYTSKYLIFTFPLATLFMYLILYKFGKQIINIILISSFIISNIILNYIWYSRATYSIRDSSNTISEISPEKLYLVGPHAHWLSMNTQLMPILYNQSGNYTKINRRFKTNKDSSRFILISDYKYENKSLYKSSSRFDFHDINDREITELGEINYYNHLSEQSGYRKNKFIYLIGKAN
jgi:4-amino-4-deoxy-L-arabinose transferase-like glycosyltransferase